MSVIQIPGHLGKDPETRFTSGGQKVTSFTVAENVRKGGSDQTIWWKITVWGDRFDKMMPHLKKGSAIMVTGTVQPPETYTKKDGSVGISLDVTAEILAFPPFGRPGQENQSQGQQQQQSAPRSSSNASSQQNSGDDPFALPAGGSQSGFTDEEMPF